MAEGFDGDFQHNGLTNRSGQIDPLIGVGNGDDVTIRCLDRLLTSDLIVSFDGNVQGMLKRLETSTAFGLQDEQHLGLEDEMTILFEE